MGMADGIYVSTYKRHFIWPPHIPRKTASIEDAKYPDICGKDEPICICDHKICACPPDKPKTKDTDPQCDLKDWTYLKGVRSLYRQSFDKDIQLRGLKKKHRSPKDSDDACEGLQPSSSSKNNPFFVARDAFRPGLPRLNACPLTIPVPMTEGMYTMQKLQFKEKPITEIAAELKFPDELQKRIARNLNIPDKLSVSRARPPAYNNIF